MLLKTFFENSLHFTQLERINFAVYKAGWKLYEAYFKT